MSAQTFAVTLLCTVQLPAIAVAQSSRPSRALLANTPAMKASAVNAPAIITGTVLGSDGRPMARADIVMQAVHSQDRDGAPEIARARADARGQFAIASTYNGGVVLTLFGANHDPRVVSLNLSPGYQLQINARLARVRYVANVDSVRVTGDFNGFRTDTSTRLLHRNADGTYSIDIPTKSDTMAYALLRLTQRGSTNGNSNDQLSFMGTGYRSVASSVAGSAHITFNPARLLRDSTPSQLNFIGNAEARAARLSDSITAHQELFVQFARNNKKTDAATWLPFAQRAMRDLSTEKSPVVREVLLLELLQLAQFGAAVPPRIGRIALNELRPNATAWTTRESLVYTLPFLPQWIADSVVHLMRPNAVDVMSSKDSTRVRTSAERLAARFDSAAQTSRSEGAQAQWMQWAVAATYGWLPQRSNEILARLQAQHPTRYSTLYALQMWGSQQKLRKTAMLPPLDVISVSDPNTHIANAQLAGKTVLIDFWATWCGPCLEEMPNLHQAYKEFGGKGLEILSISADSSVADINTFRAKRWPMPWLNGWVPGGMNGAQFRNYDIYALPRVVLIGPDGAILATGQELRGAALGATLRRVLSPSGNPK